MGKTSIEWTSDVWNPIVGCSRVSEGCRRCYAERQAFRAGAMGIPQYEGLTKKVGGEIRWTGEVRLVESALDLPLRWKKPRRIFVNSMSDLFHEKVPDGWISTVVAVMAQTPHHTYQVLTKRPFRMRDFLLSRQAALYGLLNHVWWGVSVEDQATADARIPLLLQTPAAVRWVSYEPALGPVSFTDYDWTTKDYLRGTDTLQDHVKPLSGKVDWVVVGGESGPGARPFDLAWARQTIAQGRAAGVPVFVKQLGASPMQHVGEGSHPGEWADHYRYFMLRDRKGGDPAEWPEDLRVREYPA